MRTTSVHFSPPVGCRIVLEDTDGSEVVASTLSIRDKTPFKHRTPKGTPHGQEYFYVKVREGTSWRFVKMMNSLLLPNCISEDNRFIFKGKLPDGGSLSAGKIKEVNRSAKVEIKSTTASSKEVKSFVNTNLFN
jgi:hypothetical protein